MFSCPRCATLGYRENMTYEELSAVKKERHTCTDPEYVCPVVDKEFRRADIEHQRKKAYMKKKKREGYTEEEIKAPKKKKSKEIQCGEMNVDAIKMYALV